MDNKFSLEVKKLKNITLFNPESGLDGSDDGDKATLSIDKGILEYTISSFRYLLIGQENVEIQNNTNIVLPLKKIQDILKSSTDDTIIEFDLSKENVINLKVNNTKFTLKALADENIKKIIEEEKGKEYTVSSAQFLNGLKKVKIAMGNDEVRYYLNAIYLEVLENKAGQTDMFFVATNGHTLGTFGEKKEGFELKEKAIVPRKVIEEIIKVLERADKEVRVSVKNNKIFIATQNISMFVKLIEAEFPDYNRVIPTAEANNQTLFLNTEELKSKIKKVSVINLNEKEKCVQFTTNGNTISMLSTNDSGESAETEITPIGESNSIDTRLNTDYISNILNQFDKEKTEIKFNDGNSPLIIKQEGDATLLFVLMPIRS